MKTIQSWGIDVQHEQTIGGDRRNDKRYDMQLELRWRLIRRRRTIASGTGQTIDMSSGGILFAAGVELPAGLNVELSITWPILLHNVAPMQLVVNGRILRSRDGLAAIRTVTHEFRTSAQPVVQQHGMLNKTVRIPGMLIQADSGLAQ